VNRRRFCLQKVVVVRFFNNHYDKRIVDNISTLCKYNVNDIYDTGFHINIYIYIYHCIYIAYGTGRFCAWTLREKGGSQEHISVMNKFLALF